MPSDREYIRLAMRLARRGLGHTSPNPIVGAVLVKRGKVIGRGWHRRAGAAHAEIAAIQDAQCRGHSVENAAMFVTLEPCSTHGRTPPCTAALLRAGINRVVVGATDPNPRHRGRGLSILAEAGVEVTGGVLAAECTRLNEAFNHWIVHRTPFVTVKAAMTFDGKIATAEGQSKWITGGRAREWGMKLRSQSDAILVGINTILADDPRLTCRTPGNRAGTSRHRLRRIVLDTLARTPLDAQVLSEGAVSQTTVVVGEHAPGRRVTALRKRVDVLIAPLSADRGGPSAKETPSGIDLRWVLRELGEQEVTSLLVEGGGEVNASFLLQRLAHRIAFFYAPKVLGGGDSLKAVGGSGASCFAETVELKGILWRRLGPDWLLTASVET